MYEFLLKVLGLTGSSVNSVSAKLAPLPLATSCYFLGPDLSISLLPPHNLNVLNTQKYVIFSSGFVISRETMTKKTVFFT